MEKNEQKEEYLSIKLNKKINNENTNVKSYEEGDNYNFSLFDEKTNNNIISDNSPSSKAKKNDLDEENLHEFLNYDLINSLNNDNQIDSNKYSDHSNSSIKDYTSINSDKNLNHSSGNYNDCTGEENLQNYDNLNQINSNKFTNSNLNNNEAINKNNTKNIIKNDIKFLNDPLFAPKFIPKKLRNKLAVKNEKEEKQNNNTKKELKIGLKNKFDVNIDNDNVKELMIKTVNKIKKKIHFEIRTGDWMCLWCRNLNFAYRIRCNRCGLLKKSTSFLYINNNYRKSLNFKNKILNNNNYKKEELINIVSDNKKIF